MSRTARIAWFGSAGGLVIAGALCAALLSGATGQVLGFVLIGLGLILATALVFFEVGLSEDRERAREELAREELRAVRRAPQPGPGTVPERLKRPNLERSRGHRRRLG